MTNEKVPMPSAVIAERVRQKTEPGERRDPYKVAQIYQGGAMRVALPAGAAMAQYQLFGETRPIDRFDGTSSGVPPWMYLLSGSRHAEGMSIPYDELSRGFIRLRNLLTVGRIVNLDLMNDAFREGYKALDYEAIMNHPTETHVYATSVSDGEVVDFQIGLHALREERGAHHENGEYVYFCHTAEDIAKAIAATTHLPFYGGRPLIVEEGLACVDGGISSAGRIPLKRAIGSGASHIFILSTEKSETTRTRGVKERFAAWWLWRYYPGVANYWAGHEEHLETMSLLNRESSDSQLPLIEVVRVDDKDIPSQTETRPEIIYQATEAGRLAMLKAFEPHSLPVNQDITMVTPEMLRDKRLG